MPRSESSSSALSPSKPTTERKASLASSPPSLESHPSPIETLPLPNTRNRRHPRACSTSSPDRHSTSFSTRPRARTSAQSKSTLHLDLSSTAVRPETLCALTDSSPDKPSAPIDIPARKKDQGQTSRPTTPLTARAPQEEFFASWRKVEPRISESLTPYYSSRAKKVFDRRDPSFVQKGFAQMSPTSEASRYTPSSPLSLKASVPSLSNNSSQKAKTAAQSLKLAGLPRYHPANFPSSDSSAPPPSLLGPRSAASQPRSGRGSHAKQQLLQYQRDLVTSTAKTSYSLLSSSGNSKPTPPRLNPLLSPGGPMTPFMLEGAGDYLVAGSGSLAAGLREGDERQFVERLVRTFQVNIRAWWQLRVVCHSFTHILDSSSPEFGRKVKPHPTSQAHYGGPNPIFCTISWTARQSTQANTYSYTPSYFINSPSGPGISNTDTGMYAGAPRKREVDPPRSKTRKPEPRCESSWWARMIPDAWSFVQEQILTSDHPRGFCRRLV